MMKSSLFQLPLVRSVATRGVVIGALVAFYFISLLQPPFHSSITSVLGDMLSVKLPIGTLGHVHILHSALDVLVP